MAVVISTTKICKTCGEAFTISDGELTWLEERGLKPFERCKACRKKRKDAALSAEIKEAFGNGR